MNEQAWELLMANIKEMKADIKILMAFKWKIGGMAILASTVMGILMQIILYKFGGLL